LKSLYYDVRSEKHQINNTICKSLVEGREEHNWYSDSLRAGRYRDWIPVQARFPAPIQTGSGPHPASHAMGTGSFPGVKKQGLVLTTHPYTTPSW